MGRKRSNKKIKNKVKEICLAIIVLIALFIMSKFGILAKIDSIIASTGLSELVDTSDSSNVYAIPSVKTDAEIVTSVSENIIIDQNKLNILFLNVGQADCELIINNGKTMLIDAGNRGDGEKVVNGIKALGITRLDYVVGTHVHEDHIGGMSMVIDSFEIGEFYLPYNTTSTMTYYKKLLTSLTQKNLSINQANTGDKFILGNANC